MNTRLPRDIVVVKATQVPMSFNAIGSCLRKEYTYRIYNSRLGNPFYVDRAWFYPKHLDEAVMQRAADQFVGHPRLPGGALCGHRDPHHGAHGVLLQRVPNWGADRVPGVRRRLPLQHGPGHGGHHRLRRRGKLSPEDIPAILASGNRTLAGPTVPPGGLYMTRLWYEENVL